jgi:hypothetical protein
MKERLEHSTWSESLLRFLGCSRFGYEEAGHTSLIRTMVTSIRVDIVEEQGT